MVNTTGKDDVSAVLEALYALECGEFYDDYDRGMEYLRAVKAAVAERDSLRESRERVLALFEEAGQNVDRLETENASLREQLRETEEAKARSFDLARQAVERAQAVEADRDRYRAALEEIAGLHKGAITRTCATIARQAIRDTEPASREGDG